MHGPFRQKRNVGLEKQQGLQRIQAHVFTARSLQETCQVVESVCCAALLQWHSQSCGNIAIEIRIVTSQIGNALLGSLVVLQEALLNFYQVCGIDSLGWQKVPEPEQNTSVGDALAHGIDSRTMIIVIRKQ